MIDINEYAPRAVELKVHGPIDGTDIEKLEDMLAPYAPDEGAVSAVIDLSGADATEASLLRSPGILNRLMHQTDKFARIAIVGTTEVQSRIVRAVEGLMPAGTLKRFEPTKVREARAFAAYTGLTDKRHPHPAE